MARGVRAVVLLVGLILVGCVPDDETARPTFALPRPLLAGLSPRVREQLAAETTAAERELAATRSPHARSGIVGRLGYTYHAYDLREAAETCYREASRLSPRAPEWLYAQSRILLERGEVEESLRLLERVVELQPDHVAARLRLADTHFERGDLERARRGFDAVLARRPENAYARFGRGRVALAEDDFALARNHFERVLSLRPEASSVHVPLALAYRGLGDEERARHHLRRRGRTEVTLHDPLAVELQRRIAGSRTEWMRASAAIQAGQLEAGIEALRHYVAANPDELAARVDLGVALLRHGDRDAAGEQIDRVLELDPENPKARTARGAYQSLQGDDEAAVAEHERALRAHPGFAKARLNLVNALRRCGRFAETLPHYERLLADDPTHVPAHYGFVFTLLRLHRHEECARHLEKARELLPEDLLLAHAQTRLLATSPSDRVRDGARALELAQQLLRARKSIDHLEAWAMALAETGDFDQATRVQQAAIDVASGKRPVEAWRRPLSVLRANLAGYQRREPCRSPWPEDHPLLSPRPLPESGGAVVD